MDKTLKCVAVTAVSCLYGILSACCVASVTVAELFVLFVGCSTSRNNNQDDFGFQCGSLIMTINQPVCLSVCLSLGFLFSMNDNLEERTKSSRRIASPFPFYLSWVERGAPGSR